MAALIEGGLEQLLRHPIAAAVFVVANTGASYLALWAYDLDVSTAFVAFVSMVLASPISSFLTMALGGNLRDMIADPIGLFIRLMFAIAVLFLTTLGAGIAALLFIVPGFYVAARWTLADPLVLLEGCGIIEALRRSWRLTEAAAWPLAGTIAALTVPNVLFAFFGDAAPVTTFGTGTFKAAIQNFVGAGFTAYGIAIAVFAHGELSDRVDPLVETFA